MNIVLLTNILTPYRSFFYNELYKEYVCRGDDFHVVVMAPTEPNRNWRYEEYKLSYSILLSHKTINISNKFIHLNKGLKHTYEKLKPDIVICGGSYMYPAVWETLGLKNKFGYKTYFWNESHKSEFRNYNAIKIKMREFMRKSVLGGFDGFWYAGRLAKEFIEDYAKAGAKYVFVPNLIDTDKFGQKRFQEKEKIEIREKYNISKDKKILFTPARLSKEKGILEFLDLLKDLNKRDNLIYVIAGDGELENNIKIYSAKHKLDVRLLGFKSETEILELYAISDYFVLPSLSDPNPLSCIEACWCSKPLLVSNHVGNYPELVQENKNGCVFNYEDKEEAIYKINEILSKDDKWIQEAGELSRYIATEIYNPKIAVKRIVEETYNLKKYVRMGVDYD